MSAGIYEYNGVYAYAINLEKKINRKKGANIVEEYKGPLVGKDLETILLKMLEKYQTKSTKEPDDFTKANLKYFVVKNNGHTIVSGESDNMELYAFLKSISLVEDFDDFVHLMNNKESNKLIFATDKLLSTKLVEQWKNRQI